MNIIKRIIATYKSKFKLFLQNTYDSSIENRCRLVKPINFPKVERTFGKYSTLTNCLTKRH
jgi:hypothetical protein